MPKKLNKHRKLLCPCGTQQRLANSKDKGASGLCNRCIKKNSKAQEDREPNGKIMARCPGCGKKVRRSNLMARWPRMDCVKCEILEKKQLAQSTSQFVFT